MKLSRKLFLNEVQYICRRPKLYTQNGTFWEVLAYIQGIAVGSRVHGFSGSHAGIQDFFGWLERKVGQHPEFPWRSIKSFYAKFDDDETALKEFARFYGEFCQELPDEEDEIEITITESKALELSELMSNDEKLSEVREKINDRLNQNSNLRDFLASEYNKFKENE